MTEHTQQLSDSIRQLADNAGVDPAKLARVIIRSGHADKHLINMLRKDGSQYDSVQEAIADER